jgi:hypothetical protein
VLLAVSLLLAAACLVPAGAKLLGHPKMRSSAARLGIAWPRYRLIGVAELAAAAGIVLGLAGPPLGVIAASGMGALLVGALLTHRRAGDPPKETAAAFAALAITALYLAVAVAR